MILKKDLVLYVSSSLLLLGLVRENEERENEERRESTREVIV